MRSSALAPDTLDIGSAIGGAAGTLGVVERLAEAFERVVKCSVPVAEPKLKARKGRAQPWRLVDRELLFDCEMQR
jgi:hypothetical protein